jgi:hypothetical protein
VCVCILVLVFRHAIPIFLPLIILSSVASLALPCFSHYLINGTIFGKTLLNIKCIFWFSVQLFFETFLISRGIRRDIIINVHWYSFKVPFFSSDFNENWAYSIDFRKIVIYQISWKPVQWEPRCSMRTDGGTDGRTDIHDEANCRFSQFCRRVWNIKVVPYVPAVKT